MFSIFEDLDFLSEFDGTLILKERERGFPGFGKGGGHLNEKLITNKSWPLDWIMPHVDMAPWKLKRESESINMVPGWPG